MSSFEGKPSFDYKVQYVSLFFFSQVEKTEKVRRIKRTIRMMVWRPGRSQAVIVQEDDPACVV